MFSRLYNECDDEKYLEIARNGVDFMKNGKCEKTGLLYFSSTENGEKLHFQRKPYSAVFFAQGMLEFSKALRKYEKSGKSKTTSKYYLEEAEKSFDLLRKWIEDPTLLGRPKAPAARPLLNRIRGKAEAITNKSQA